VAQKGACDRGLGLPFSRRVEPEAMVSWLQSPAVVHQQEGQAPEVVNRNCQGQFPCLLAPSFLHEVGDLPIGLASNFIHAMCLQVKGGV
jgi:hypothetical protein